MNYQLLPEEAVDRHIEMVVKYHKGSDTYLKYACIAASPIVGTYDGGTQAIAKRTNRHVSTIENWAHAHWMYLVARRNGKKQLARNLWRCLPVSHWAAAWDIQNAGYEALDYLERAQQYHYSSREMVTEWKTDRDAGNAPLVFHRAVRAFRGLADELLKSKNITQNQRFVLGQVQEAFAEAE